MGRNAAREKAAALVSEALLAVRAGDSSALDTAIAQLADVERPKWASAAGAALIGAITDRLARAWRVNWQPAETARHAARELGDDAAVLCAEAITAENRVYAPATIDPRWTEQVRALGGRKGVDGPALLAEFAADRPLTRLEAVECAVRLTALLERLPPVQRFLPPPGSAAGPAVSPEAHIRAARADQGKLAKVRALLAKAESTEFPDEAEALSARAQELMARHSIDAALLEAHVPGGLEPAESGRRLPVDAPYAEHKATLLNVVAEANHCRAVWHDDLGLCTVVGHPADVDGVELLFTSLLVQATAAMRVSGSVRDRSGRSADRRYRASFLMAFADRIGDRLERAAAEAAESAAAEHGRTGGDLVPLLAARRRDADAVVDALFSGLTTTRLRAPADPDGWDAGRSAADRASLRSREEVRPS